ncbi:MAG: hypothetical protein ACFBSC_19570, partial [Microcoleaceae cyanobacterium]
VEVLEWHNRQMMSQRFYSPDFQATRCQTLIEIQQTYQISHVVTEQESVSCSGLQEIYQDKNYRVYRWVGLAGFSPMQE